MSEDFAWGGYTSAETVTPVTFALVGERVRWRPWRRHVTRHALSAVAIRSNADGSFSLERMPRCEVSTVETTELWWKAGDPDE